MIPKEHEHVSYPSGAQRSDRTGKGRYDLVSPHGLRRLAIQYEEGSEHHGDERNWEKGFPISRAICSAIGHLVDHLAGDRSEDHLAAAAWQEFAAMHFEELIVQGELPVELNDVPFDANTLPPDTGAIPDSVLELIQAKVVFDVITKVDIPADAVIWADVMVRRAILRGDMKGEIVQGGGKFILQERRTSEI